MTARPGIVAGAVVLVLAAGVAVSSTLSAGRASVSAGATGAPRPSTRPVTAATLVCPSLPAPSKSASAVVSAAAPSGPGSLALTALAQPGAAPAQTAPPSPPAAWPWLVYNSEPNRGGPKQIAATGRAAQGLAAIGLTRTVAGPGRALAAMPCTQPTGDTWLVGGSAVSGRRDVLYLSNPEAADAVADVTVFTRKGPQSPLRAQGVTVPHGGQVALALDALVPGEPTVVVEVRTRSGRVSAALSDAAAFGSVPQGQDWVPPAAEPSRRQVVTGIPTEPDGRRVLTLLVPGPDDAQVTVRLATKDGTLSPDALGVSVVQAGVPLVVDLGKSGVTDPYSVIVDSDRPVVAGVRTERGGRGGQFVEFSYAASVAPMPGTSAVLPVAGFDTGVTTYLELTASGEDDVEVRLTQYDGKGRALAPTRLTVPSGRMVAVRVGLLKQGSTPVLVETAGTAPLVLGWVLTVQGPRGPLFTGGPLVQTPWESTVTPVVANPSAGLPGR